MPDKLPPYALMCFKCFSQYRTAEQWTNWCSLSGFPAWQSPQGEASGTSDHNHHYGEWSAGFFTSPRLPAPKCPELMLPLLRIAETSLEGGRASFPKSLLYPIQEYQQLHFVRVRHNKVTYVHGSPSSLTDTNMSVLLLFCVAFHTQICMWLRVCLSDGLLLLFKMKTRLRRKAKALR